MQKRTITAAFFSFVAAMSVITGSAGAQSAQNGSIGVKREALVSALGRQAGSTRIRVSHEQTETEGTFSRSTESALVVSNDNGSDSAIRFDAIDGVWMQKRSAGRGAKIGATIGAIGFGGLIVLAVNGMCESSNGCGGDAFAGALLGGAVGAAGGGIIGGTLGLLVKRWVPIAP